MNKVNTSTKRDAILESARMLAASRGFNAFSHRELADRTGIKSSSVHYYFPKKEDIGIALIENYQAEISGFLDSIAHLPVIEQLEQFTGLFWQTAKTEQDICLAGMFASDLQTLGERLQDKVRGFFLFVEKWLSNKAEQGGMTAVQAQAFGCTYMAALEGALLMARLHNQPQRIIEARDILLRQFIN